MTNKYGKAFKGATATLAAALIASQTALAAPALLMGDSICDNQADSFDFAWVNANNQNVQPFFLSGTNAGNGVITPLGHTNAFDNSGDVFIALHGWVDKVGDFTGTDFATVFLANHATTPQSVTFYVCQSGTAPSGGVSSMAAVARKYPGQATNSTLIGAVNAPSPNTCPALAVNATSEPFTAITTIQPAVYHTSISTTSGHNNAENALTTAWTDATNTPYPNTTLSFKDYCTGKLQQDPTGATWVLNFINEVETQFATDYLALINTNYAGNALATCGPNVQCD